MKSLVRVQYSLLSFTLLLMIMGAAMGIWANRAHRQREAVRRFRNAGARVEYSDQVTARYDETKRQLIRDKATPYLRLDESSWFRDFLFSVVSVEASGQRFSDVEMSLLGDVPSVQVLGLGWTNVTSRGVAHVRRCPDLVSLNLDRTAVDDSCLFYIADLKGLRSLQLGHTSVSNESLSELWQCSNLRTLGLSDTKISQAAVEQLRRRLRHCNVAFTPQRSVKSPQAPGTGGGFAVLNDRAQTPLPDRTLTADELAFFMERSDFLIRKPRAENFSSQLELEMFNVDRRLAAEELGQKLMHRCTIPVLASVVRDDSDDPQVRISAVGALAWVADPIVVEILIETIPQGDGVGLAAEHALVGMMYVGVGREKGERFVEMPLDKRIKRQSEWHRWWTTNRNRFQLRHKIGTVETFLTEAEWEIYIPKVPPESLSARDQPSAVADAVE